MKVLFKFPMQYAPSLRVLFSEKGQIGALFRDGLTIIPNYLLYLLSEEGMVEEECEPTWFLL